MQTLKISENLISTDALFSSHQEFLLIFSPGNKELFAKSSSAHILPKSLFRLGSTADQLPLG